MKRKLKVPATSCISQGDIEEIEVETRERFLKDNRDMASLPLTVDPNSLIQMQIK